MLLPVARAVARAVARPEQLARNAVYSETRIG